MTPEILHAQREVTIRQAKAAGLSIMTVNVLVLFIADGTLPVSNRINPVPGGIDIVTFRLRLLSSERLSMYASRNADAGK